MARTDKGGRPQAATRLFVERQIHLYSDGKVRTFVLSPRRQATMAASAALVAIALLGGVGFAVGSSYLASAAQTKVKTTPLIATAPSAGAVKGNAAVAAPSPPNHPAINDLIHTVERRDAALTLLLKKLDPAAVKGAGPVHLNGAKEQVSLLDAARADQERLINLASAAIHGRLARLERAFKTAHLNPATFESRRGGVGEGGPFIDAKDPRALAHFLDVDEPFAANLSNAAGEANALHSLSQALARVPFGIPVSHIERTSSFGERTDPFTGRLAFHPGQDFRGAYRTPIHVTAAGVVAFTGQRTGYGNTIEVDHGHGLRTRYAHLAGFLVRPGQSVAAGQTIGAMGSTGRSTGVHLHYEVWQDGRLQNPDRFLKAGQGVQQGG
jgi:murein DD-endopeptidase MepM/ murein hydrolase activator NlpD